MSEILTTKDLTKNELGAAKILAAFVILAGLVVFFNSAHMEEKDLPEISFTAMPSQTADGSGQVSFEVGISKLSAYDTKLKVEYSLDGINYLPVILAKANIDSGSLSLANDDAYQISKIISDNDSAKINFSWDTKANAQDNLSKISIDQIKIRITLAYQLKSTVPDANTNTNTNSDITPINGNTNANTNIAPNENSAITPDVIINPNETIIENGVIIEPGNSQSDQATDILPQNFEKSDNITAAIIDTISAEINSAPDNTNANVSDWSELSIISDNFKLDNAAPEIISGQVDLAKAQIYLNFNEAINTDLPLTNDPIKLQNENLAESTLNWINSQTLVINLSSAEQEKYTAPISDWILKIDAVNNWQDLSGNKFSGGLIPLTEQTDEVIPPEIKPEDKPKDEEIKKDEEVILPEKISKIINTRGYNKNCSFDPNDIIMAAGETSQTSLSLVPRDADSKYFISSSGAPKDFEVKILTASGTGSGPINLEVTAPANAAPRLYKILIKYQDILPQAVGYVNNCVLRLIVQ